MAVVLIVDDSPTQAENQKRILETAGHQVIFAENGDFGIAQAKSKQPDVILMDVVMNFCCLFMILIHFVFLSAFN